VTMRILNDRLTAVARADARQRERDPV
jgi:hypothetical protein